MNVTKPTYIYFTFPLSYFKALKKLCGLYSCRKFACNKPDLNVKELEDHTKMFFKHCLIKSDNYAC